MELTIVQPKKVSQKCLNDRLHMVKFVREKGLNIATGRINWKWTVMEWNKAHYTQINVPYLKASYYRAVRGFRTLKDERY